MAIAATMVWEVRSAGNSANGGGFDPTSGVPGTDYSQQNSAQIAFTDLVIDGTTNTNCTSAGNPFTSAHVGNIVNITGGTGFTVQRVQVMSVAAGVATMDKSLGTLSSTGGTGNLGGALASFEDANAVYAAGNTIYIQEGSFTKTTTRTITCTGSSGVGYIVFIGYPSGGSRTDAFLDESDFPDITSATNSTRLLTLTGASRLLFKNLKFSHTAATRGVGVGGLTTNSSSIIFENCSFDGCSSAYSDSIIVSGSFRRCTIKNCTGTAINQSNGSGSLSLFDCLIHDNAATAVTLAGSNPGDIYNCIFDSNTGTALNISAASAGNLGMNIIGCDFYNNGSNAINFGATSNTPVSIRIENCIFDSNGGYGIVAATANLFTSTYSVRLKNNAFYNNTSGQTSQMATGSNHVTLTSSPFTNAGSQDFSLNSTAGGGADCAGAGRPTIIGCGTGTSRTSYPDIGTLQKQATNGAGGSLIGSKLIRRVSK